MRDIFEWLIILFILLFIIVPVIVGSLIGIVIGLNGIEFYLIILTSCLLFWFFIGIYFYV